ncbi:hypothetical protein DSECCO2_363360 [anaerobic digester metagenome]
MPDGDRVGTMHGDPDRGGIHDLKAAEGDIACRDLDADILPQSVDDRLFVVEVRYFGDRRSVHAFIDDKVFEISPAVDPHFAALRDIIDGILDT